MKLTRAALTSMIAVVIGLWLLTVNISLLPRLLAGAAHHFVAGLTSGVQQGAATLEKKLQPPPSEAERARQLATHIDEMELQLVRAEAVMRENRELRQMLALPMQPEWSRTVAMVIARDPATWHRRFRIDKGRADGVIPGAAVLEGTEVIGRVITVDAQSAMVATLADPICKLSVRLVDADAVGILGGRISQPWGADPVCLLDYLPRDAEYRPGMIVETSGLSQAIPAGLRVGRTMHWNADTTANIINSSYAQMRVRPTASFRDIRYVTVLRWAANDVRMKE